MTKPNTPAKGKGKVRAIRRSGELSAAHREHLQKTSGLTDETIELSKVYTEPESKTIRDLLGRDSWRNGGGLVFPYPNERGEPVFCRVRPDRPRKRKRSDGGWDQIKYEQPLGTGLFPYLTPRTLADKRLADPALPLVLTEGEKKALCLDQLGYATIGGAGVWGFHDVAFRHEEDRFRLHPLLREIALSGRRCVVCFDSDHEDNDQVMWAARVLAAMLFEAGAGAVRLTKIPSRPNGEKRGIDDLFIDQGEAAVREVVDHAVELEPASLEDPAPPLVSFRALRDAPVDRKLRMPSGYDVRRDGTLWRKESADAEPKRIEREPILVAREIEDLDSGELRVELVYRGPRGWRTALVDRQAIADTRAASNAFAPLGLPIDSTSAGRVVEWLRDVEHKNRRRLPRTSCVTRCGWRAVEGSDIFMLDQPIAPESAKSDVILDVRGGRERIIGALRTAGDRDRQLDALRQAFAADRVAATVIAGALAAPMLRCLAAPSFAIHLPGDSSKGKSSMLKIAASLYGDPRSEEWIPSWNSTSVGLEVRAATLCDLPLCIDEAGVVDAKTREAAVYMLISGTGRTRGARGGGLRDTLSWRTVVLSTGEHPLAGETAQTGAQARVLQLHVHGFGDLDASGVDALRSGAEENFGWIGREWLEALVSTEDWEPHRKHLKSVVRALQKAAPEGGVRARQAAFFAVLACVEGVAHDLFGIGTPDGATMRGWITDRLGEQQRVLPIADRALELVQGWRSSQSSAFGRLSLDTAGKTKATGVGGAREVLGYVDDRMVMFIPYQLRSFLDRHGLDYDVVVPEWRRRGWLVTNEQGRMTRRVRIDGSTPRLVAIRSEAFGEDVFDAGEFDDGGGTGPPPIPQGGGISEQMTL